MVDLSELNSLVNNAYPSRKDEPYQDLWGPSRDFNGQDCANAVTEKTFRLISQGISQENLGVGCCYIQSAPGRKKWRHVVLLCNHNDQVYALDINTDKATSVEDIHLFHSWFYVTPKFVKILGL